MTDFRDNHVNLPVITAIVAVATIGGFMFGYDSGVVNGTQDGLRVAFALNDLWLGITVGALLPGCALGAYLAGRLADRWGRRRVLMIAAAFFVLSALVSGAAPSALVMIVARLCAGTAVGAASVLSPAYIAEVTPASLRGRLASAQQVMIIAGLTGAFLMNYLLAHVAGASTATFWGGLPAWRWMYWAQVLPAAVFLITLALIPESPRYLVARGRLDEARQVLRRLFGDAGLTERIAAIDASMRGAPRPTLRDLIDPATGRLRRILWVGIGLAVFQQLVGINAVFYYGAVLWQSVGFSESDALKINILSGALSIGSCIGAIALIDRVGRRPLLLVGSAGMAVTLSVLSWAFGTGQFVDGALHLAPDIGLAALISANAYVMFFNLSWGPVMWVMLGEMFPNRMRGSALAVSGAAQWAANFMVSVSFPVVAKVAGLSLTYGAYASCAVISLVFVGRWVHETRGRELEAMEG
jgi:MFS transporter, SP family, sugar:H+ symporter